MPYFPITSFDFLAACIPLEGAPNTPHGLIHPQRAGELLRAELGLSTDQLMNLRSNLLGCSANGATIAAAARIARQICQSMMQAVWSVNWTVPEFDTAIIYRPLGGGQHEILLYIWEPTPPSPPSPAPPAPAAYLCRRIYDNETGTAYPYDAYGCISMRIGS